MKITSSSSSLSGVRIAPLPELDGSLLVKTVSVPDPLRPGFSVYSVAAVLACRSGFTESAFAYDVARSFTRADFIAAVLCRAKVLPADLNLALEQLI